MDMETQRKEFGAAANLRDATNSLFATAIVDDDYPQQRHRWEGALQGLVDAMKANGRFDTGNRYGLKKV